MNFPLLVGLLLSPLGASQSAPPVFPYLAVPIYWNQRDNNHRLFLSFGGTELPVLEKSSALSVHGGEAEHLHWRPVALASVGYAITGGLFVSAGAQIGEGIRYQTSIGVRFWPFSGDMP